MEKYYSKQCPYAPSIAPNIKIRFGKGESLLGVWKKIVAIEDKNKRKEAIDAVIDFLESDTQSSGFIDSKTEVDCGASRAFLLDDRNLYYQFFENLMLLENQNIDSKVSNGSIINQAIKATITNYAGGNGVDRKKRFEKTDRIDGRAQSIKEQKGENCFYCTEKAAISHNLWLMTGATSYFCWTDNDNFGESSEEYKNDTHNFTIVEYDDKFKLYDLSMNNFCILENDCIEDLLSGRGLEVKDVQNPGIYAKDFSSMTQEQV